MSRMIINEFPLEGRESRPAGGGAPGGRAQREGRQAAGAGPGWAKSGPDSAGRLLPGSVPHLSSRHHVLEVGLAPG